MKVQLVSVLPWDNFLICTLMYIIQTDSTNNTGSCNFIVLELIFIDNNRFYLREN